MNEIMILDIFSGTLWQIIGETSAFGAIILLALTFMSLTSWVIIFHKWREFRAVNEASDHFANSFKRAVNFTDIAGKAKTYEKSPISRIFSAGFDEMNSLIKQKNQGGQLQETIHPLDERDYEIIEMTMERVQTEEINKLESRVVFLAITGSSAPFMGLLGTVVGIMNSFWSIGERGSASLAIVAPGIAEALLATIVGLGAAIPAVMAYNWANNKLKNINDASYGFILNFIARAKRNSE